MDWAAVSLICILHSLVCCLIILQPRAVNVNFEIEFITTNLVDVVLLLLGKSQDVECLVGKSHILLVVNRIDWYLKKMNGKSMKCQYCETYQIGYPPQEKNLFLHCFRVYFSLWKCFFPCPAWSGSAASRELGSLGTNQEGWEKFYQHEKDFSDAGRTFLFLPDWY